MAQRGVGPHGARPQADEPDSRLRQTELSFAAGSYRYLRVTWDDARSARVAQAPGVAAELLSRAVARSPAGSAQHGWLASRLANALYRVGDLAQAGAVANRALRRDVGDRVKRFGAAPDEEFALDGERALIPRWTALRHDEDPIR